jgi:hypothetical protein
MFANAAAGSPESDAEITETMVKAASGRASGSHPGTIFLSAIQSAVQRRKVIPSAVWVAAIENVDEKTNIRKKMMADNLR